MGLAVLAFLLAGCSTGTADAEVSTPVKSEAPSPAVTSPPPPVVPTQNIPLQSANLQDLKIIEPIEPANLLIPDLGIDLAATPEGLDAEGNMSLPKFWAQVGWYQYGAGLDAASGAVILAAHVDTTESGLGPLVNLRDARIGQVVTVTGKDGIVRNFQISETTNVTKGPQSLDSYFDPNGPYRLVLITCGGPFDAAAKTYIENIVVTAVPVA